MLHVKAQDHLEQTAFADLHLLEDHEFGWVVGIAQVPADPEQARAGRQVQQHLHAVVGRLFGFAVAQLTVGDDDLLVPSRFKAWAI